MIVTTETAMWSGRPFRCLLQRFCRIGIFCCLLYGWSGSVSAGGVAEFGTVSKSKITLNPAGAAAVDRVLFDVTLFGYEQENRYATLGQQARIYDSPADVYFEMPYPSSSHRKYYRAESIAYEEGEILGFHLDLAYPTTFFTIGLGYDDRRESFEEGTYYNNSLSEADLNSLSVDPALDCGYTRTTTSVLLAVPLRGFSLGVRQNTRQITYRISNLESAYLYYYEPAGSIYTSSGFLDGFSEEGEIAGNSRYQFTDFGVMLNVSLQPKLDIGYLYRPPVDTIMEFDPVSIGSRGSSNYTMADLPFTEPGLNLTTLALGLNLGSQARAQLIAEAGDFTEADRSFQAVMRPGTSRRDRAYDVDGYLFRFTYNPYFELGYGVRSQEIAGSLTVIGTQTIKFPIPFLGTLIVSVGRQTIQVLDDQDETVAETASYSFSAEMKFGQPVTGPGRQAGTLTGASVPPKTKRLPFYMEY